MMNEHDFVIKATVESQGTTGRNLRGIHRSIITSAASDTRLYAVRKYTNLFSDMVEVMWRKTLNAGTDDGSIVPPTGRRKRLMEMGART